MDIIYKSKKELFDTVVKSTDVILDVGFYGQGMTESNSQWGHRMLRDRARDVFGLDIVLYVPEDPLRCDHYTQGSAERFSYDISFDKIFAGDLVEHLSNPGLFLDSCSKALGDKGELILTTPNCFNLFNLTEKLLHSEPTVNRDHTCYFNPKTISQLLAKNNWEIKSIDYIYSLELSHQESFKKRLLNIFYKFFSRFTPKFVETMVVIAVPKRLT